MAEDETVTIHVAVPPAVAEELAESYPTALTRAEAARMAIEESLQRRRD